MPWPGMLALASAHFDDRNVMPKDTNPAAGSPDPEDTTAAEAQDTAAPAEPAAEAVEPAAPLGAEEPIELDDDAESEEDVEYDAYYVPAGTVVVEGPSLVAKLGAELFGTFVLVLVGLGVALYAGPQFAGSGGGGGVLAVALGFGLAVAVGAAALGHVSGGHFNPAVTLGAAIAGRTSWSDVLPYWLAQLVGGALGAAAIFAGIASGLPALVNPENPSSRAFFSGLSNGYGEHSPLWTASQGQASFSLWQGLLIELLVTGVFVGVILGVTDRRTRSTVAPFAIGLALAILILVAMPATNASLNPVRSTAAAIFSETWALKQLWLFWVAPLVGAALAGVVYRAFASEQSVEDNLLEEDDVYVTQEDTIVVEERRA